jgi:hypothetical protein
MLGCASNTVEQAPPVRLTVTADYRANDGKLFYVLIAATHEQPFLLAGYQDIAAKVFAEPPDPNTLKVLLVEPGSEQEVDFNSPSQGQVGLYFLFTDPGAQWKKLLPTPLEDEYELTFPGGNQAVMRR